MAALLLGGCPSGPSRNPRLSKKLYWLGRNYYRRAAKAKESGAKSKFLDEAFVNLKKSVKNNKKNYKARTLLGYIYLQKADQELGMAEVSQCLRGDDGKESRSAADTLSKRAREQFEAAVEAEPKCTSSWLGLVNVAMHFNEYEKAIKLGRKVIDTLLAGGIKADCSSAGDKAVAWANMGWAHFHKRRLVRASKNLRQALFLAPKFCLAHYWLGRVLYAQGKHEEAARELEYTARTFGLPQAAHQYLGLAKLKLGEKQSARAAFRRCVRLAPNSCTAEECKRYLRVMVRGESTEAETGKDVEK